MALLSAQKIVVREIQRLHKRRAPLNISAVKRSHPKLIKRVYSVRPFWGWKRALEDAGLDYKKINVELRNYVDCKICGRDLGALSYHLINDHTMTGEDYHREYPGAEMTCETARAKISLPRSRKRYTLPRWEAIWTPEHVLDRMAEMWRRKLPLNFDWAKDHDVGLADKAIRYFGSWDEALRLIGLDPARIRLFRPTWRGASPWRGVGPALIIAELRRREAAGKPLSWKSILPEKAGPAFLERAKKLFGSWSGALAAAGLDPFGGAKAPWTKADRTAILAEVQRRRRARESLRPSQIDKEKWGQPLLLRCRTLFGSWNAALLAAGMKPLAGGRTAWPRANKAAIVTEIRRRENAGQSLRNKNVMSEPGGRALFNRAAVLFGTWNAALLAAGVEPARENSPWPAADKTAVLAEIRRRKRAGESLATTKVERSKWGNPLINRAKTLFGTWAGAIIAAGVDLPAGLMSPWPKASKAGVVAEIRRRKRAGATLHISKIEREPWGSSLAQRARILFGSWNAALIAAGFEMEATARVASPWSAAKRADILAGIRRRKRAGKSLRYTDIQREPWGSPLLKRAATLFGSWTNALLAANVEPVHANSPWPTADKAAILAEIRRRSCVKHTVAAKEVSRQPWGKPLVRRAIELFGSWTAAILAAGLTPAAGAWGRWPKASKAEIITEIRRRRKAGEPVRSGKLQKERWSKGLLNRGREFFGSWDAALEAAGIQLAEIRSRWPRSDKAAVIAELRRRHREGQSLRINTLLSEKEHSFMRRTKALFGTWNLALLAAELDPVGVVSPWFDADKAVILAEIRRRKRAGESLRYGELWKEQWGIALLKRANTLFGSWNAALLAAGLKPAVSGWSAWPRADQAAIVTELRRRHGAAETLVSREIEKERWGGALVRRTTRLFGSWRAALQAAGIDQS